MSTAATMCSGCPRPRTSETVAVVFGAAVWPGGVPSPTLLRRTRAAAALFHAGTVSGIVVSGGVGRHGPSEADVMARILRDAHVPEAAILREDRATSTIENVTFSLDLIGPGAAIVAVSDRYHLPRIALTFRALGRAARLHGAARAQPAPRPRTAIWMWLREAVALPVYAIRLARLRVGAAR